MSKYSTIALGVGKITVWQGDGVIAEVQGTKLCKRDLDDSPTAHQWQAELDALIQTHIHQTPPGKHWCSECAEWIDKENFTTKADNADKLDNRCNDCKAEKARKRRFIEAESVGRKWRWAHKAA